MSTSSQGKDTVFINKINLSSSFMNELKIGVELLKRKKEAEQAILEKKRLELLKKEEEEAANRLAASKKKKSELVVSATELLEQILKKYESDLFALNISFKKLAREGNLVKGYVDGQEIVVDLKSQSMYKIEYFDKIAAKDIIQKLDNVTTKKSLFRLIPRSDFESSEFVNRVLEITRFADPKYKYLLNGMCHFTCGDNVYYLYSVDTNYRGFNYIKDVPRANQGYYYNVLILQKRYSPYKSNNNLEFLTQNRIIPLDNNSNKGSSYENLVQQFGLGFETYLKQNVSPSSMNKLVLNKEKFKSDLYKEDYKAVELVTAYPPAKELWEKYQVIRNIINDNDVRTEVENQFSKVKNLIKTRIEKVAQPLSPDEENKVLLDSVERLLLESDFKRANLAVYGKECLTDIKQGHWDLFGLNGNGEKTITLQQNWVARPPQLDIDPNMVCGIDFGTKSTVVACRRKSDSLLSVGCGDLDKVPEAKDYENPTVLEFIDLESFKKAYQSKKGRPYTKWSQVKTAHGAEADLLLKTNKEQYGQQSFISDLKQWAGDEHRRIFIEGKLKTYAELREGDMDPIEIYAYYLGLYINRMLKGICLHYALSFPVTYSDEAVKRLVFSFKKGLWKSLPEAVQNEKNVAKVFKVYAAVSEPAAYAACMFKVHRELLPKKTDNMVAYGVFDFGGGTTDFDFGIVNKVINPDDRTVYQLTHFGSRGDQYLGGENLLALLGYEVYHDTKRIMLEKRVPIVRPASAESIVGLQTLVQENNAYSAAANRNSKLLAEALRNLWEKPEEGLSFNSHGKLMLKLWNEKNQLISVELAVNISRLNAILETKLKNGIENFFRALRATRLYEVENLGRTDKRFKYLPIHIFLAGNSCKSQLFQRLFEERKLVEEEYLGDKEHNKGLLLVHVPTQDNVEAEEYATMRTGKTGVAFGLLECYKGARRFVIKNEEEKGFKYYLGFMDDEDTFKVTIQAEDFNEDWKRYTMVYSDEDCFEIYYSSEPRSVRNNGMSRDQIHRVCCNFDIVQSNVPMFVWLKKKSATSLQYSIGSKEEPRLRENSKIYEIELARR